ncbi:MAG TPA: DUF1844 domain-containing protein [Acidobacteriaceae bacterium]|nr:DUF1844 domain-containing protein [Acidobacteriaceae bacterium]
MSEKEPQFVVSDRRKFTLEGELREGETPASESKTAAEAAPTASADLPPEAPEELHDEDDLMPEPTAEESAQQSRDYHASARQMDSLLQQANAGSPATVAMNFDRLVQSIYMTAAMQMGAGTAPDEQPRIDIVGARQSIDMLGVLEEKTRGNLSEEEKRLLQSALFDLRMSYIQITNAINSTRRPLQPGTTQ